MGLIILIILLLALLAWPYLRAHLQAIAVLDLVANGKSNKQIAWELSISETTVKAHMTAILRKLGVNSRAQAIVLFQRQLVPEALPQ